VTHGKEAQGEGVCVDWHKLPSTRCFPGSLPRFERSKVQQHLADILDLSRGYASLVQFEADDARTPSEICQ
jgi:hypothetical protein